ncbi:testis-expressed protein 2-like [Centruroides sculpturatus]|uniref:testis-expressed protein 2-like n=1 Tax=Centruroides sculpturatus TaxID=218467 RepID=UPI000C6ED178|nr:testis-expressed protein 2-like [Centruroides sculpturatus]
MAAKLTLSKIKGSKPSSSVPLMSFRFLPNEDDLEEVTPEEQENEKEIVIPFKSSNTYPISLNEKYSANNEISNIPHSLSTESNDIFKEKFSTSFGSENELTDRFGDGNLEKTDVKYSSSFPSEPIKLHSESMHNVVMKETRDSSPMKESVKDYLAKFGKKSSSLENSPATETDSWSLFNELKGRITKTFEEKITRESNYSSKSLDKLSNQKSTELVSPSEMIISEKDMSLDFSEKSTLSLGNIGSEDKTMSSDYVDADRKSVSSEDQLPLSIDTDSKSFSNFNENTDDSTDMSKCVILTSNANQKKSVSTIAASAQALLSPKRTRPSMSVTLSSLMAAKVLDSDSIEENKSDLDTPETTDVKESKTPEELNVSQVSNETDSPIDSPIENPTKDNFLLKACNKYPLSKQLYVTCTNLFASWQNQIFGLLFIFIVCLRAPIPPFLSGFIIGIIISIIIGSILWWLFHPINSNESLAIPDYANLPKLTIPSSPDKDTDIYKGWMNELPLEYNPDTYHVNCTHSVYVRLDGTSLRLSHPKNNIPKRAMWNEVRHDPVFIHQRHFNIAGATVSLLPEGLARKRLWSKKYPICLEIPNSPSQVIHSDGSGSKETSPRDSMSSFSSLESFDDTPDELLKKATSTSGSNIIYLFARTSREKEEWYWLLYAATKQKTNWLKSSLSGLRSGSIPPPLTKEKRTYSADLGTSANISSTTGFTDKEITKDDSLEFNQYMTQFLDREKWFSTFTSFAPIAYSRERRLTSPDAKNNVVKSDIKESMLWLNALIGRIFYNFLTEKDWSDVVVDRIQKKLDKIRVPYFIQELKLTDINLGKAIPQIQRASDPVMDDKGVWVDLDITYNGSFEMTLETKLNLLRLKKNQSVEMGEVGLMSDRCLSEKSRSYMLNSEEEDSAESSSDDELYSNEMSEHGSLISATVSQHITTSGSSTSKKLLRWVDKLAQSKCFQQATENKFVKRAMEEVSNTPLFLTVEIHGLIGTLAINIPPLPTDRLWYGFRKNPQLSISARPKFGERKVTLSPVTDWIKKKLVLEFQKILVMPNMDDLIIPIMNANLPSSKS